MNGKLSVIIPYKHGNQLRQIAMDNLMKSIEYQTYTNFETIIIEEISHPIEIGQCIHKLNVDKYILLKDNENEFNKSWCINVAMKQASSDKVVVIDADSLFDKSYFNCVTKYMAETKFKFFHAYDWIILLSGKDNPITRIVHHKNIESTGGSWFCDRNYFFNELGGMNENYFGYGREDGDLWVRASRILSSIPELKYPLTHSYHDWEVVNNNKNWKKNGRLLNYTKGHIVEVIDKLKIADLGNPIAPTLINMEE